MESSDRTQVQPNFFIVGAPKCGTTSLYQYLLQHPDVFMTEWKEPHYWSKDLYRPARISTDRYYALFKGGEGKKRIGEASTEYIYSQAACASIKQHFPDAKIIIMLRNPIDMIHSGHSQRVWHGRENIRDFEEALAAEADRKAGRRLPPYPYPVETLFYRDVGMYGKHVRRYLDTFGTENVKVIIFEEFVKSPPAAFAELCAFLDIDPQEQIEFGRYNQNKIPRFKGLPLLLVPASPLRSVSKLLPTPVHNVLRRLAKKLMQLNTRREERVPMRLDTRCMLEECFRDDVANLSEILSIDLAAVWGFDKASWTENAYVGR